jgi:hypothetical protein
MDLNARRVNILFLKSARNNVFVWKKWLTFHTHIFSTVPLQDPGSWDIWGRYLGTGPFYLDIYKLSNLSRGFTKRKFFISS